MAILWTFIGQNMDFGQKLAKTWETLIRHQHPRSTGLMGAARPELVIIVVNLSGKLIDQVE